MFLLAYYAEVFHIGEVASGGMVAMYCEGALRCSFTLFQIL